MMWCDCQAHPKCECCATGSGEVSVIIVWPKNERMLRDHIVCRLECETCWEKLNKPLPGIHRPPYADDLWHPSIDEHIRLSILRLNAEDEKSRDLETPAEFTPLLKREHEYTPAQIRGIMVLRSHAIR